MARDWVAGPAPSDLVPVITIVSVPGGHRTKILPWAVAAPVTAWFSIRKKPGGAMPGSPGSTETASLLPGRAPGVTTTWTASRSDVRADTAGSPATPTSLTSQPGPAVQPPNSVLTPTTRAARCPSLAATALAR